MGQQESAQSSPAVPETHPRRASIENYITAVAELQKNLHLGAYAAEGHGGCKWSCCG